jgi:hypothetical protein
MSTALPAHVRGVIDTDLSDSEIQAKLDDAEYRNEQANDVSALSEATIRQIEKYLAALLIRETKDRPFKQASSSSRSVTYSGSSTRNLRARLDEVDPSGELADSFIRDTDRHVSST